MNNKRSYLWMNALIGSVLVGFSASVFSFSDASHWIEVRILDKQSERAVTGAAVCLGTTAKPDQFGAKRSDEGGVVRFENLTQMHIPLVATVSKQGFRGRERLLEPLYPNRVVLMRIAHGGGGPACDAAAELIDDSAATGLTVDRIDINADAGRNDSGGLLVSVEASGPVNQIRISERADFADASWQIYQPAVSYLPSQGKGLKQIHVQVRRVSEAEGAIIQVASQPKKVQYRLR